MIKNNRYKFSLDTSKLAVIGLGYVGLPLAVEFGKNRDVIGFDVQSKRISELRQGCDTTLEVDNDELKTATKLKFTDNLQDISNCNVYIVTVPTPIDKDKQPDLTPLINASESIGRVLKEGDIVIYESTVYPGATEEECVPILEKVSGLKYNVDFFAGYSPERINPGDKEHRLRNIVKVTSGSNEEVADFVDILYDTIIEAGTHKAPSIRVAEAAKVIENTQRDINIAFINELAIMFEKMNIKTKDVLEAAETKWNFLPFKPGLVGGHCIGVDPYYLAYKAQQLGYSPQIILAGRHINDGMGSYVAKQLINLMSLKSLTILNSKILVLGITFKENCSDIRNSKVIDIIEELKNHGANVSICDPCADKDEVKNILNIDLLPINEINISDYSGILLAVAHEQFLDLNLQLAKDRVIYDVKSQLDISDKAL